MSVDQERDNPGGMRFGDGEFRTFSSVGEGWAAMAQDLTGKLRRGIEQGATNFQGQPLTNVRGIVSMWAPSIENDTNSIIETVAKEVGVSPDTPLALNAETIAGLMRGITKRESGMVPSREQAIKIAEAAISGRGGPLPAPAGRPQPHETDVDMAGNDREEGDPLMDDRGRRTHRPTYASAEPTPPNFIRAAYTPDTGSYAPDTETSLPTMAPLGGVPAPQAAPPQVANDNSGGLWGFVQGIPLVGWVAKGIASLFNGNNSQQSTLVAGNPGNSPIQQQELAPQIAANAPQQPQIDQSSAHFNQILGTLHINPAAATADQLDRVGEYIRQQGTSVATPQQGVSTPAGGMVSPLSAPAAAAPQYGRLLHS